MSFICLDNALAIISVSGEDCKTFLQGQLTNDINLADTQNSIFAAHLNNKGRVLATFIITKIDNDLYYLLTTREIIDNIVPRLKMFILRSRVRIDQIDNQHILLSNSQSSCTNKTPSSLEINEASNLDITPTAKILIINENKFGLIVDKINTTPEEDTLSWKLFLIQNKIPLIYTTTVAEFIPQHINYDTLPGVSFTKGCYTGQEIVARTHYLGKAKRRMYQFTTSKPVTIGTHVTSPKMNNQDVGIIVEVVAQNNTYFGLASLQNDCVDEAFINNIQINVRTK